MAKEETKKEKKPQNVAIAKDKAPSKEEEHETLIRIFTYDIPGSKKIYVGLTFVKGVSWAISKLICKKLNLPLNKKVSDLSPEELKKIESFLKNPEIPEFFKNRRSDPETGESKHLYGADLDLQKDFDIKRLRQIKSYKGIRHALKLPVRGQKTRSHFRTKGRAVGVRRKSK